MEKDHFFKSYIESTRAAFSKSEEYAKRIPQADQKYERKHNLSAGDIARFTRLQENQAKINGPKNPKI